MTFESKIISFAKRLKLDKDPIIFISLFLITIIGLYLRLHEIGKDSLWYDEILTVVQAKDRIHLFRGYEMPLYYVFENIALYFGKSEFIVRLSAAIFGVLSIPLIYKVGEVLYGKEVGVVSAFLLSISAFHIHYSQENRPYSMFMFFSLLTIFFLCKLIKEKNKKLYIIGFIISTCLNILSHGFAIFVTIVEILFIVLLVLQNRKSVSIWITEKYRSSSIRDKAFFLIFVLSIIIISIITINQYLPAITNRAQFSSSAHTINLDLSFNFFINIFSLLGAGKGVELYLPGPNPDVTTRFYALYLFLAFFSLGILTSIKKYRKSILLLTLFITIPFVILFTVKMKEFFHIRYIIFILPVYLIITSKGITDSVYILSQLVSKLTNLTNNTRNRLLIIAIFIITCIMFGTISVDPIKEYYGWNRDDWRGAANYLKNNAQPGDKILVDPTDQIPLIYYYNNTIQNTTIISHYFTGFYYTNLTNNEEVWFVTYAQDPSAFSDFEVIDRVIFSSWWVSVYKLKVNFKSNYFFSTTKNRIWSIQNVKWDNVNKFIQPYKYNTVGTVIYKFESDKPIKSMKIIPSAYVVYDNNYVKIYASSNGSNYTLLHTFIGTSSPPSHGTRSETIDVTSIINGSSTAYIKIEMYVDKNTSVTDFDARLDGLEVLAGQNISKIIVSPSLNCLWNYSDNFATSKYLEDSKEKQNIKWNKANKFIQPYKYNTVGTVIYKFESDKPIKSMKIIPSTYVVYDNNYVKVYASSNGSNYTLLHTFIGTSYPPSHGTRTETIDATSIINGSSTAYIKIEMYVDKNTSVTDFDARLEELEVIGSIY